MTGGSKLYSFQRQGMPDMERWPNGRKRFISPIEVITMQRHLVKEKISEEDRMRALGVLPEDMRDAYISVTRSHRRLLERLAQK
jgi:hypothetical protein